MNITEFNSKVTGYNTTKIESIKDYLNAHVNSDEVYLVCREMYQNVYDGLTKTEEGHFAIFISDDKTKLFGESLKMLAAKIGNSDGTPHSDILNQLIETVRLNYPDTANTQEIESRTYFQHNSDPATAKGGSFGKMHIMNMVPNWREYEIRLKSFI